MKKVQKPSNSECYTASADPIRTYENYLLEENVVCAFATRSSKNVPISFDISIHM
jgi:hypothetical protein